jgi:outer membrane protein assembly factor BamB
VTETVWENADIPGRLSNAVLAGDQMFGLTSRNLGQYYAVEAKTGKILWTSEGRQASNVAMVRAGNVVFSLENDGELVVLRASQTAFEPHASKVADAETGQRPFPATDLPDVSTLTLWTPN